jgi:hypothetical protein
LVIIVALAACGSSLSTLNRQAAATAYIAAARADAATNAKAHVLCPGPLFLQAQLQKCAPVYVAGDDGFIKALMEIPFPRDCRPLVEALIKAKIDERDADNELLTGNDADHDGDKDLQQALDNDAKTSVALRQRLGVSSSVPAVEQI